ncbi:hypothetical protein Acsp06_03100 [Actinomycetospora sp. NBRC 106375]|uniref:prepilin peptidase n=1 Tax=Actinomycetospora sp. NBRC 106375 TaxID=3032207 RepID=UPI0024A21967|nr:prepilin peptidase [Actinomycetospora sp. NBRC 106375]GLZ44125.1 hypothetical protein Acsp06_03100 [Actinomycetospora sp. NBRC 106375]
MTVLLAAAAGGGAGALTGCGVRTWLARMRRGVLVPGLPCAAALAVLWAASCGVVGAGVVSALWLPAWLVLGALGVAGSATDLAEHRLPDALTLPAAGLACASLVPLGPSALVAGVLGALLLGGVFAAVHLAAPRALGAGDVKLAPAVGAPLAAASWGALAAVPVIAAGGVLALLVASSLTRDGPVRAVPYGPPLLLAAWSVLTVSLSGG